MASFRSHELCFASLPFIADNLFVWRHLRAAIENLKPLTPDEVGAKNGTNVPGNKQEFLRAARGLMTEEEANKLESLIEESCE